MEITERDQTDVDSDAVKRAYTKPQVADFGALHDLTLMPMSGHGDLG